MRFAILTLLVALFVTYAMAAAPYRSVIISWPNETPDEIVEQSKEAIRKAKGKTSFCPYSLRKVICAVVRETMQDIG